MNEEHVNKIHTLISHVDSYRLSSNNIRLTPVRRRLEIYETDIRTLPEDARDYCNRTGKLPGETKSQKTSYTSDAVRSMIMEDKTPEEAWNGILQKVRF